MPRLEAGRFDSAPLDHTLKKLANAIQKRSPMKGIITRSVTNANAPNIGGILSRRNIVTSLAVVPS